MQENGVANRKLFHGWSDNIESTVLQPSSDADHPDKGRDHVSMEARRGAPDRAVYRAILRSAEIAK